MKVICPHSSRDFVMNEVRCFLVSYKMNALLISEQTAQEFLTSMFNNKPEIYFSTRLSSDGDASRTGVIIKFSPSFCSSNTTRFPFPSDLYTISGTTVTWNTSHPLYNILYGKSLFEV